MPPVVPAIPWRAIFEKMSEECESYNLRCLDKLLADQELIILKSPYWYFKLDQALRGQLHILATDEVRNITVEYLKPLIKTHYIYIVAPLLSEAFLDANLKMEKYLRSACHTCVYICVYICVALYGILNYNWQTSAMWRSGRQDRESVCRQPQTASQPCQTKPF
jgi:hypothetical protein